MDYELDFDTPLSKDPVAPADPGSPTWMLWIAVASLVVSALLLALGPGLVVNLIGYLLASVVCFSLVALFRRASFARLVSIGIGLSRPTGSATVAIIVTGLFLVCIHAYLIARHYA